MYYFEVSYLGNLGNYQTVGFGANDVCQNWLRRPSERQPPSDPAAVLAQPPLTQGFYGFHNGLLLAAEARRALLPFRQDLAANTYLETAPLDGPIAPGAFPGALGVDRILVRVTERS